LLHPEIPTFPKIIPVFDFVPCTLRSRNCSVFAPPSSPPRSYKKPVGTRDSSAGRHTYVRASSNPLTRAEPRLWMSRCDNTRQGVGIQREQVFSMLPDWFLESVVHLIRHISPVRLGTKDMSSPTRCVASLRYLPSYSPLVR
jgi:hypothetical protein